MSLLSCIRFSKRLILHVMTNHTQQSKIIRNKVISILQKNRVLPVKASLVLVFKLHFNIRQEPLPQWGMCDSHWSWGDRIDLLTAALYLNPQSDEETGRQHFGVRVCHLVSDKNPVPMVLEMMLEHVEMHGLYTEGIYRKSGSANRMKELHQRLETG